MGLEAASCMRALGWAKTGRRKADRQAAATPEDATDRTHPEPHHLAQGDTARTIRAQGDVVINAVVVILLGQGPVVVALVAVRQRAAQPLRIAVFMVVLALGLATGQLCACT